MNAQALVSRSAIGNDQIDTIGVMLQNGNTNLRWVMEDYYFHMQSMEFYIVPDWFGYDAHHQRKRSYAWNLIGDPTSKPYSSLAENKIIETGVQVASRNEECPVTVRMRNINANTFEIKLQEEEGNDGSPVNESVNYVAIEYNDDVRYGDKDFYVGMTGGVTSSWKTITFPEITGNALFAHIASYNGVDPVSLRRSTHTSTSVRLNCHEEKSLDSETSHTGEEVRFLIIER